MITQELLSIETSKEIDLIALDRIFWIEENFEAIENWMRYNVVKVSPTYPPTVEALNEPSL